MSQVNTNSKLFAYVQYNRSRHPAGSGTPHSYGMALEIVDEALIRHSHFLAKSEHVWEIRDQVRMKELYDLVLCEQGKADGGIFRETPSSSYWKKHFCSAAVKDYSQYLTISQREQTMLELFDREDDASALSRQLGKTALEMNPLLLDDGIEIKSPEGRDVLRTIKARLNQAVFRKMVLKNYHCKCCLTGLPVPEILRASHISPWATDKKNRMNPENGLCLSATYDAAFDRHLISFDDDWRLILAPSLKEYVTNQAFQEQFLCYEGRHLSLPSRFLPSQALMTKHRQQLA